MIPYIIVGVIGLLALGVYLYQKVQKKNQTKKNNEDMVSNFEELSGDCPGNDLKIFNVGTSDGLAEQAKCAEACMSDKECKSFALYKNGNCHLKSISDCKDKKTGGTYTNLRRRIIKRKVIKSDGTEEVVQTGRQYQLFNGDDCRVHDQALDARINETLDSCKQRCDDNERCLGISYRESDGRCVLKRTNKCNTPYSNDHVFRGVVNPVQKYKYKKHKNMNCPVDDYFATRDMPPESCKLHCDRDPKCKAFLYTDNQCFFKASNCNSNLVRKRGVDAYTKLFES